MNPSVVDEHIFKANSHQYGVGQPTGGASTWDAVKESKPENVKSRSSDASNYPDENEHRSYHGVITGNASINNVLGNEANQLTTNAPELGKPRSGNPTDAAHRVDRHTPSTKEKVVGQIKVLFGKATGDSDILSSGEALRDGDMERGSK